MHTMSSMGQNRANDKALNVLPCIIKKHSRIINNIGGIGYE